MLPAGQGSQFY